MKNPFNPPKSFLVKLGSLIVHYEEFTSPSGHPHDKVAIDALRRDPEVDEWLESLQKMQMLPVKR